MTDRVLRCYVRGREERWEAMCIDLDIAVEASSRADVVARLEAAVFDYIRAAARETPEARERLLRRRAPAAVRWRIMAGAFAHLVLKSRAGGDLRGGFEMACPA